MRTAALASMLALGVATVAAAQGGRGGTVLAGSVGAYLEENHEVAGERLTRVAVPFVLGLGSPRRAQLDIEPAFGWFSAPAAVTTSGISYTRLRLYYFFGAPNGFSVGPDVEAYLKTERVQPLGFGYDRFMPGVQASYRIRGDFRTILRVRYEGSVDEDSGVTKLRRIAIRPSVYLPRAGALSSWVRSDILLDLHGAPTQYNVEAYAGLGMGPRRGLTLFVEPRVYVGAASRTKNLWRLRSGLIWSLGTVTVHHTPTNDTRTTGGFAPWR